MKRLLLTILCLLFAYPCFAAEPIQLARMSPWVAGSVAASCSNDYATDFLGDKGNYSAAGTTIIEDRFYCIPYQAVLTCATGTFRYPYLSHNTTTSEVAKVYIYSAPDGSTEPNGNTLVGSSAEISCDSDNVTPTCTNSTSIDGTINDNQWYLLCVVGGPGSFQLHRNSTTGTRNLWYKTIAGGYASPPATLSSGGWTNSTTVDMGAYIDVQ